MTELTAEELAAQIEQQKLEEHKNEVRISHPPLPLPLWWYESHVESLLRRLGMMGSSRSAGLKLSGLDFL
jgi:hypothetical protein